MSRAELARQVGLTKVTVSDLVSELLESGHAIELGPSGEGRPGKPGTLVDVNRTGLQIVGLDLAAHEVLRAAVLDLDGNILARAERPLGDVIGGLSSDQSRDESRYESRDGLRESDRSRDADESADEGGEPVLDKVLDLVREIVAAATAPLLGIGVGTPGIVLPGGVVGTAPNLGWTDVPLRDLLVRETGLPVFVCNDADAAVHAHYTLGDGGDDLVLVKIGRGVGCGLIVGGQRVRGAHFAAGEIGHVTVGTDGGAPCRCGKVGCLETWLSVPNLERALAARSTAAAAIDSRVDSAIGSAVDSGVAPAEAPLREAGERLGIALAPVVGALDLSEVVLSGPEHLLGTVLLEALDETLRARTLARPAADLVVRLASDSEDIVLRGASVLVLWDQLGVA